MNIQHSAPAFPCRSPSSSIFAEYFFPMLNLGLDEIQNVGRSIPIPIFAKQQLLALCKKTLGLFRVQGPIVYVQSDAIVISGLHGDLHKLLRIFKEFGRPPTATYVFLGDFADGGEYSLEVVEFLFTLAISYPANVFLVRGRNEFYEVSHNGGFQDEVIVTYRSPSIWEQFQVPMAFLPTAAVISGKVICTYGCLSDSFRDLLELMEIEFPIDSSDDISRRLLYGENDLARFANHSIENNNNDNNNNIEKNTNEINNNENNDNNSDDDDNISEIEKETKTDLPEFLPNEKKLTEFLQNNNLVFYVCTTGKSNECISFAEGKAVSINGIGLLITADSQQQQQPMPIRIEKIENPPKREEAKFENITPQFDPFKTGGVGQIRGISRASPTIHKIVKNGNHPKSVSFTINSSVSLLKMPSMPSETIQAVRRLISMTTDGEERDTEEE